MKRTVVYCTKVFCFVDPCIHPEPSPHRDFVTLQKHHSTSSFAPVIILMAARGLCHFFGAIAETTLSVLLLGRTVLLLLELHITPHPRLELATTKCSIFLCLQFHARMGTKSPQIYINTTWAILLCQHTHTSRFICSHKINNYPKVWNNSVVTDKNANLPEPSVFICWQFISWRNNIY